MTIKAFAAKYGIKYSMAAKAAQSVKTVATLERDIDFLEKDLYMSLMRILSNQIQESDKKTLSIRIKQGEVKNIAIRSGIIT